MKEKEHERIILIESYWRKMKSNQKSTDPLIKVVRIVEGEEILGHAIEGPTHRRIPHVAGYLCAFQAIGSPHRSPMSGCLWNTQFWAPISLV